MMISGGNFDTSTALVTVLVVVLVPLVIGGLWKRRRAVRCKEAREVDGKTFFRSARDKLSYEDFSTLLASMKRLNNQEQTRDQTLNAAKKLLGLRSRFARKNKSSTVPID
jgi:hypothetical protein